MEPYTTKAAPYNADQELLKSPFLLVHPETYAAVDQVDRATLEQLVNALVEIGTPEQYRDRAMAALAAADAPAPKPQWALDGVLGSCPYGAAFRTLDRGPQTGLVPTSYEEYMTIAASRLYRLPQSIQVVLSDASTNRLAGMASVKKRTRCSLPTALLRRLVPLLYSWIVDWEFFCTFTLAWRHVSALFCSLCPGKVVYALATDESTGATHPELLFTLPWWPLFNMFRSLRGDSDSDSLISVDPAAHRWLDANCKLLVTQVAIRSRSFFAPDALEGIWREVAPCISSCSVTRTPTTAALHALGLFLPVAHLTTVPFIGCQFHGDPSGTGSDSAVPQPRPLVDEIIKVLFSTILSLRDQHPVSSATLTALFAIAVNNTGLVSFDAYAEPVFSTLLDYLKLPTSQASKKADKHNRTQKFGTLVNIIACSLPADTTSPLWNQLRRFLHAVEPLLRPDTAFQDRAKRAHACLHALVKAVTQRVYLHQTPSAPARPRNPQQARRFITTGRHRLCVPGHQWTAATTDTFATLLAPLLMPALAMKIQSTVTAVVMLSQLAPVVMLPRLDAFVSTVLWDDQHSAKAAEVAFSLLCSCTALMLENPATQPAFLSLTTRAASRAVEEISQSNPSMSAVALRWLAVVASVTPVRTLTGQSVAAEVEFVRDVMHRALKAFRGVDPVTNDARSCAALVSLFLDSASADAFTCAVQMIVAECRVESNGLFCVMLARACGARAPQALLPLLDVAAGPLRAAYTESRVPQLKWAMWLASSVIAGSGLHVLPCVPLIVECIERQLTFSDHAVCVDAASELTHQLVRALTRRRCLGKSEEVFPTPLAPPTMTVGALSDSDSDDDGGVPDAGADAGEDEDTCDDALDVESDVDDGGDVDMEDDDRMSPASPRDGPSDDEARGGRGVPLWLCHAGRARVIWEDPTDAHATCALELLERLLRQSLDYLRDPSRPFDGPEPARGLDELRGLATTGEHAWRASRVVQGAVTWLAELWGVASYVYTSTSLEAMQAAVRAPPTSGAVAWHDHAGNAVDVPANLGPRRVACALTPAPAATLNAVKRHPAPFTDADVVTVLLDVVLPRFGGDVIDLARVVPLQAFDGAVNLAQLQAVSGALAGSGDALPSPAGAAAGTTASLSPEPEADSGEAGVDGSGAVGRFGVAEEVMHCLSSLVKASYRLPGTDIGALVHERCATLRHITETSSRRRPAGLFAAVAAAAESISYASQQRHVTLSAQACDRVFKCAQLLVLCPHPNVSSTSGTILYNMCLDAVDPVNRLLSAALVTFMHRVLAVTSRLAPSVVPAALAAVPLLIDDEAAPATSAPTAACGDEKSQRALVARLHRYFKGLLGTAVAQATDSATGGDGTVLASLFTATLRMSSVFFNSAEAVMRGKLESALSFGCSQCFAMTSSSNAVTMEHLIRMAAADCKIAPQRATFSLRIARHYCSPTLRLFFWRRNHATAAVAHRVTAPCEPVLSAGLVSLLVQMAGHASPSLCTAALKLLQPQWLLFDCPVPHTHVVARVNADGVPQPLEQSSQCVAAFCERVAALRAVFADVDSGVASDTLLPRTVRVGASRAAVQQACPQFECVDEEADAEVNAHCLYTFSDLRRPAWGRAGQERDPAEAFVERGREQYRAVMHAAVRQHADGSPKHDDAEAVITAPFRECWTWRLVRWMDEATPTTTAAGRDHGPRASLTTGRRLWTLLAMALGTAEAVPLLADVMQLALADAVADAHGESAAATAAQESTGADHDARGATTAINTTTTTTMTTTDKLGSLTLCGNALWVAHAAVEVTARACACRDPMMQSATPTSTAQRDAALSLLHDAMGGLCDWRLPRGAAQAATLLRSRCWRYQSQEEIRHGLGLVFDRIARSSVWAEQKVGCIFLEGLLTAADRFDVVPTLLPAIIEHVCANETFFLSAGAQQEINVPIITLRYCIANGSRASVLESQLHHGAAAVALGKRVLDRIDQALTAVEASTRPAADLYSAHRDDLAIIQSSLMVVPLSAPHPTTVDLQRRSVTLAVRALDLTLPQVDATAHAAQTALLRLAGAVVPKEVAHAMLELLCDILEDSLAPLGATPRAKTVLGWALEQLLFTNLHRIGKYALMQRVACAAQACMTHRDGRVQTKGKEILSALVRVATKEQVRVLSSDYMKELRAWRPRSPPPSSGDGAPPPPGDAAVPQNHNATQSVTRRQLALVMSLCAILLAFPADFPSFVPSIMRLLVSFADVPTTQHVVRQTFRSWWDSHRKRWQAEYRDSFSAADAQEFSAMWNASYYA